MHLNTVDPFPVVIELEVSIEPTVHRNTRS
jgi:hypothetical protein